MPSETNARPGPPPFAAKAKLVKGKCSRHPRYEGYNAPKTPCEACWRIYLRKMFGNKVRPLDEALVIDAADPQELNRFVDDLVRARDSNVRSGGGYAAFFHTKDGVVIQFNCQVPISELAGGKHDD